MAHPTRTGDLVVFSSPPYQFDAATPGTLVARSAFFGQHGYVPDVQDLAEQHQHAGDVPRRRDAHRPGTVERRPHHRPRADDRLPARRAGAAAQPGQRAARAAATTAAGTRRITIIGLNDFHGQLDPPRRSMRRHQRDRRRRRAARDHVRRGGRRVLPGQALLLAGGDNVGASPPNSALLEDMPAIDVENAWGLDATSLRQPRVRLWCRAAARSTRRGRTSRSSPPTSSRRRPASRPTGSRRRPCSRSTAIKVGVIGADAREHA